ncbi:MAG: hypothetical protein COB53_02995 [Elusimicrobia bacterium]|nr:MAG: hypothetical protein COB53_02995 [Elusimicrobiota bacterium]
MPRLKTKLIDSISELPIRQLKGLFIKDVLPQKFLGDLSFFHLDLPMGKGLPDVRHLKTEELVFCFKGSMVATVGNTRKVLTPGDFVRIPRGTWHKFETPSEGCEAFALFHPYLAIEPGADIHCAPGISLWDDAPLEKVGPGT